ncbi:histidine kinase dimerization/phosphoacceptor domain -containing protein [Roseibacterium sp. SDUM158017]|uniref:sensor histidine kinase n=1 Tax=Roseicyclus salinarum TaxID=3036773 RepID=UPI00241531F9|nr:histidine kinase dimerization/phosphoacceptor domain -containing protein [Roseibacterium sp. SDUM158017]MDG4647804.1 histidine kinase dimerization/phosphoacceptor domain -containing protein [Roseibacterium sp. SDUM158017]
MRGRIPVGKFWFSSLRTRLIVFLSIALLPIGSIAVYQTVRVVNEAERLAERDVLARTVRAAAELQSILQRAFGAGEGLGAAAYQEGSNTRDCIATMAHFVDASLDYTFAGFIELDGRMRCTSSGETIDYTDTVAWRSFVEDPRPTAFVTQRGDVSAQPVLVAFVPILDPDTGALLGGQAVSTPEWLTEALLESAMQDVALALVSPDGGILASNTGTTSTGAFGRIDLRPENLQVPADGRLVELPDSEGELWPVALVPLIEDWIFVAGIWGEATRPASVSFFGSHVAPGFPILMWLATTVVAYLAVNSLVLQNLRRLSWRMRRFRSDHNAMHFVMRADAPREFQTIAESYNAMVDRITEDRNTLQENVREKELLLREVHHRVKNNLQLIASILNMQIRNIASPDAKRILARVQDRVMSLSTIHKALYSGSRLDCVRADRLLAEIIDGVMNVGLPSSADVEVVVDLDPLNLDPDQAVPLSLLATEAVTNATKHLGAPSGDRPRIAVSLVCSDEDKVVFTVTNTRGKEPRHETAIDGSSLGARLIEAFASQLAGRLRVDANDREYSLVLEFRAHTGHAA